MLHFPDFYAKQIIHIGASSYADQNIDKAEFLKIYREICKFLDK